MLFHPQASLENARLLADLYTASIHKLCIDSYTKEELLAWAPAEPNYLEWYSALFQSTKKLLVSAHHGIIQGFITYYLTENNPAHIEWLYVHPDFARCGIATELLLHVENLCRDAQIPYIYLTAAKNAVPFYERHGFAYHHSFQKSYGNVLFDCQEYRKYL